MPQKKTSVPNPQNGEALRRFEDLVANAIYSRSELWKKFLDPRRDIDDECGYPTTSRIAAQDYRAFYDREPIATRVVQVFPLESWRVQPEVYETEELDHETSFEDAWSGLAKSLRGESWFEGKTGSPIWEHLKRVDELSGIGTYGILLLGLDDGKMLSEPAEQRAGMKLLFLRAFDESLAAITKYESDVKSPRYGQPIEYLVTLNNLADTAQSGGGLSAAGVAVHWSRVIHVADNQGSSEVFGVPRMRPVLNRLYDLRKLYSGSAEMYWRGAFPGLALETNPELGGDVTISATDLRSELENYMNGLQRYLALSGMTAKSLAPQVVDPTAQINVQLDAICVKMGIPKRIFVGSERGELASSQDERAWNGRVSERQQNYLTPRLIVPFVDRLISLGVLPEPEAYHVDWPELASLTPQEQAVIAVQKTDALAKYVQGGVEAVMAPMDYLTRVLGMDQEETEAILQTVIAELGTDEKVDDAATAVPE